MEDAFIPILIFLLVYIVITFEIVNKAITSLFGVTLLIIFGFIEEHRAVEMINFETIMLLLGMMTLVAIIKKTGFFIFLSIKIAEFTKGSPIKILILFSTITAILSAFLDNVTTVLIIVPVEEVEWSTLLFFAGLFILVGALEEYGVLKWIAQNVFLKVGDNPYVVMLLVLWVSGIASGFLDNIPFTITMIPIVQLLLESIAIPANILWWALALGACFGGNFTLIGASANIISIGIARQYKENISFLEFMKSSAAIALISLVVSSVYLSLYLWMVL